MITGTLALYMFTKRLHWNISALLQFSFQLETQTQITSERSFQGKSLKQILIACSRPLKQSITVVTTSAVQIAAIKFSFFFLLFLQIRLSEEEICQTQARLCSNQFNHLCCSTTKQTYVTLNNSKYMPSFLIEFLPWVCFQNDPFRLTLFSFWFRRNFWKKPCHPHNLVKMAQT